MKKWFNVLSYAHPAIHLILLALVMAAVSVATAGEMTRKYDTVVVLNGQPYPDLVPASANARASPTDEYCVASPGGDKMQCLELGEHGKRYPKTKWCNQCHEKSWTPKKIKDDPHIPV